MRFVVLMLLCLRLFAAAAIDTRLANGLRVMLLPDHRVPQVSVHVWYNVGSKDEVDGHTGLAHIVEHMLFQGTKAFPDLWQMLESFGGVNNAFTNRDYTCYFELVPKEHLQKVLELEADRMQNLEFTQAYLTRELKVVQEERLRSEQWSMFSAAEHANAAIFVRGPYHHLPIGWMSDINNTKLHDVSSWYKNWYVPNNATLVIGGDIEPGAALKLVNKIFGAIPPKVLPERIQRENVPLASIMTLEQTRKNFSENYAEIKFVVPSLQPKMSNDSVYALYVLSYMLGVGESAIMHKKFVTSGKANSVSVSYNPLVRYQTTFSIGYSGSQDNDVKPLLALLRSVAAGNYSKSDFARAKVQAIAQHVFSQDDFYNTFFEAGNFAVLGLEQSERLAFVANIQAVTNANLQAVAKFLLRQKYLITKLYKA